MLKTPETTLDELRCEVEKCENCRLSETRKNVVFGEGSGVSGVMFVGEAPGAKEDAEGRPFCGRSGALLDDLLAMIALERSTVFIANITKCRPPENRDPLNIEQDACIGWLRRQVKILQPKVIVCLGRIAAKRLIHADFKMTEEHGRWFEKGGFLMTATFHPAALLRNPNNKPPAFEDFWEIRRRIDEMK